MKKKLKKIGAHTWIFPLDSAKDRPNLGYVLGENTALAIDAGHSSSHVEDFYEALDREGLPLPDCTVITHWHWDHTFGMHAVRGRTMARPETNRHLNEIRQRLEEDPSYGRKFLQSDPCIRREYAGGVPLAVVPVDVELTANTTLDLGGVTAEVCYGQSPHTEDALLIYVPEDHVLFIGDAQLGRFPSWAMDFDKLAALREQISGFDARIVIDGHWTPYTKEELLAELV